MKRRIQIEAYQDDDGTIEARGYFRDHDGRDAHAFVEVTVEQGSEDIAWEALAHAFRQQLSSEGAWGAEAQALWEVLGEQRAPEH